jgi:TIR domain
MALFTASYFRNIANNFSKSFSDTQLFERNNQRDQFDIFLSHSLLDKEVVKGIYMALIKQGYSVYVDWIIDPGLDRKNVTKLSAEKIRSRLKSSKSLILALSENVSMSKWIPWELGFVDGNKNGKCALLPISDDATNSKVFLRSEYLKLYPYIKNDSTFPVKDYAIVESGNTYTTLSSWTTLNSNPSYKSKNIDLL